MISKIWNIRSVDEHAVKRIAAQVSLSIPIARALALRGLESIEQIEAFVHPRLAALSDPFLLPDMDKAVNRIWAAIDAGEAVTVFGDYDVDGITSAALVARVLAALGADVTTFIPSRLDEGYGLSLDAMQRCIADHNPAVLVTVDCGVNSIESVRYAQVHGVDVIVTDHHEPQQVTAPAFALINPRLDQSSGLENLSGVGVAFKTAHALVKSGREAGRASAEEVDMRDYLDLVALGTVADIVPLIGENRILVRYGLGRIQRTRWAGMKALKEVAGLRGNVEAWNLGFQLGPRINAAGRIGQPEKALQLLTTDNLREARTIAKLLDENNIERRRMEREMADEAFAEIDGYFDPARHYGLVVAKAGWHPGVVGIVASRVSRHYNRPAIIMGIEEGGCARGSCRSIEAYNILDGLQECESYLNTFGGHMMAAGLELKPGKLEAFRETFNASAGTALAACDLSPVQRIDAVVDADQIDWDFLEQLKGLRPFGQHNPEPVWLLQSVRVSGSPRVVGQQHLKLAIVADGRLEFDAIAFNYPLNRLPAGAIDIAFTLKENHWNGSAALQLQIQDIRSAR